MGLDQKVKKVWSHEPLDLGLDVNGLNVGKGLWDKDGSCGGNPWLRKYLDRPKCEAQVDVCLPSFNERKPEERVYQATTELRE